MLKKLLIGLSILWSLMSCSSDDSNQFFPIPADGDLDSLNSLADTDFNILFVGNSLTYTNDLPYLVEQSAERLNLKIGTRSLAYSNYAIIDHYQGQNVHEEIASGEYDFVVMQQGPSSQEYGREILIEYGARFKAECDHYGAELVFFMVWPSRDFYHTFDGVIKNYTDAANLNDAILCPVGSVWKAHFDATGDFSYYGTDGFHPSLKGSQVAADVIVDTLFR